MIDIHSHILPKIDDGSTSVEETFELIEEAYKMGFTDIISTSHYIENYYETNEEERKKLITGIQLRLKEKNININIHVGTEIFVCTNISYLIKAKKACTLANSNYVLFELPINDQTIYLRDVIFEILTEGMIPIIAHPERYKYFQEDPNLVMELIEAGVLFQMNYASIIGNYGKKAKETAKKLLEHNMIHFLGTDVHRKNTIYSQMNIIIKKIEKIIGNKKFAELSDINPKKILDNEKIYIEDPIKIKKTLFK